MRNLFKLQYGMGGGGGSWIHGSNFVVLRVLALGGGGLFAKPIKEANETLCHVRIENNGVLLV